MLQYIGNHVLARMDLKMPGVKNLLSNCTVVFTYPASTAVSMV